MEKVMSFLGREKIISNDIWKIGKKFWREWPRSSINGEKGNGQVANLFCLIPGKPFNLVLI